MKLSSPKSSPSPTLRLLGAALLAVSASAACGDDEAPPAPQPDFGVSVVALDGASPDETVTLRCDGTVAVGVEISTSIEKAEFKLSPAAACGESKRCGYVRIQGLAADDTVLSQVDSVTTEGVLELASDERALLSRIKVGLIRGLDQAPVVNKDGAEVTTELSPSFALEADCDEAPSMGGQGGQGGAAGAGGLAGAGGSAGGAAGADAIGGAGLGGLGGAPGDAGAAGLASAGLGGQQP